MHLNKLASPSHGAWRGGTDHVAGVQLRPAEHSDSRGQVCLGAKGIIGTVICHGGAWLLMRVCWSQMAINPPHPPPSGLEMRMVVQLALALPAQECTQRPPCAWEAAARPQGAPPFPAHPYTPAGRQGTDRNSPDSLFY